MTQGSELGSADYRGIGLVGNPFTEPEQASEAGIGVPLAVQAAALRALSAVTEAAAQSRPRPVRVVKCSKIPSGYHMQTTARVIPLLGQSESPRLLPVFVPLFMMRKGRIRGTLSAVSEILAGRSVDLTLASYARAALAQPDTSLPEWESVSAEEVATALARLDEEPAAWVADLFGPPDDVRMPEEDRLPEIDRIMTDAGRRSDDLNPEPIEDDATLEAAEGEFESATIVLEPSEAVEALRDPLDHPLVSYVIAHAKEHVSPVVARGLRSYVTDGTTGATQEFKITRAPRKTLAALAKFACFRFDKLVIIFDQFEGWETIPEDIRADILGALSEMRFALGPNAVIVVLTSDEGMPEMEEQYAGAIQVHWDFEELIAVQMPDSANDLPTLQLWLDSAAVPGADVTALRTRVEEATAGSEDLESAVHAAYETIEAAVREATAQG